MGWGSTQRPSRSVALALGIAATAVAVVAGSLPIRLVAAFVAGGALAVRLWLDARQRAKTTAVHAAERRRADAAFAQSPTGIALIDPFERTWLAVNDTVCRLLGRDKDDLLGRSAGEVTHPDDAGVGVNAVDQLLLGEPVVRYEKRYVRPDGTVVHGRVTVQLARDEHGDPLWLVAHIEDVSELHRLETRAQHVLAALRDGIVVRDEHMNVIACNDAALEQLGLTYDTLGQRAPMPDGWHLVDEHGEPLPPELSPDMQVLNDGKARLGLRVGIVCPGREIRWFVINALPLLESGTGMGVVNCMTEVTDQLAAERELVRARDRFEALVEHSTDMSMISDAHGGIAYASPAWNRILAWDPTAPDAPTLRERIHPEDAPTLSDVSAWLHENPGESRTWRFRAMHSDGSWRHLEATVTNLLHDEAVQGFVANAHDVNDLVAAAEYLTQLALHDGLTGLANRRLVFDRVERAIEEQRRDHTAVAVLYLDLDGFKDVNDAYGHAAGDEVLEEVARRLEKTVRGVDTVGRLGGDEFVVVASLRQADDAQMLVHHVETALAEPVKLSNGHHVVPHASIGIVVSPPDDPFTPDRMLTDADDAMYEAKRHRRRLRALGDA